MTPTEWAELLLAAQADPTGPAANRLFEECRPYLILIARKRWPDALRARDDPSDLVQQTHVEALKGLPRFVGSTLEEWRAYCRTILLRRLINRADHHRSHGRNPARERQAVDAAVEVVCPDPTPHTSADRAEQADRLTAALQHLSPDHREVIGLRTSVPQPSWAKIGASLDCTAEAARKLYARAIRLLSERMPGEP